MANKFGEPWVYIPMDRPGDQKTWHFVFRQGDAIDPVCVMDTYNQMPVGDAKRLVDIVNICAGLTIDEVRSAIALMDSMREGKDD